MGGYTFLYSIVFFTSLLQTPSGGSACTSYHPPAAPNPNPHKINKSPLMHRGALVGENTLSCARTTSLFDTLGNSSSPFYISSSVWYSLSRNCHTRWAWVWRQTLQAVRELLSYTQK